MSHELPPKRRILYPTAYIEREREIEEARVAYANLQAKADWDIPIRYDPEFAPPRRKAEPRSLSCRVRRTVRYKRTFRRTFSRR
jgi:hypothetical protein